MAVQHDVLLADRQLFARRDPDHLRDDINIADHLRNRMFHLHPSIHLDEVELTVLEEKLEGTCAAVVHPARGIGANPADPLALRIFQHRAGGLLQYLLVAALE